MDTKHYLQALRGRERAALYVSMRQALCYYLDKEMIPNTIIRDVMHYSKSNVYNSINQARGMLDVGDKIMQRAYEEISHHKIRIVPCTVEGDILSRHVGYKMLIDNEIF